MKTNDITANPRIVHNFLQYLLSEPADRFSSPTLVRFFAKVKVDPKTRCWNWTGATHSPARCHQICQEHPKEADVLGRSASAVAARLQEGTANLQVSCGIAEGREGYAGQSYEELCGTGISRVAPAVYPLESGDSVAASGYQAPPAGIHFVKGFSSSSGLKSRNPQNSLNFFSNSGVSWRSLLFGRIATYWAELMRRTLAPLRKIVARELEVFEFGRNSVHPQSFAVHDRLECGHIHTSLLWDIFDLLNAYTESPHVRAIRHRCQECLTLTQRKPVQSVAAVSKAA